MMPKELLGSPFQNPNRHQSIHQELRAASLQREGENLRKRSINGTQIVGKPHLFNSWGKLAKLVEEKHPIIYSVCMCKLIMWEHSLKKTRVFPTCLYFFVLQVVFCLSKHLGESWRFTKSQVATWTFMIWIFQDLLRSFKQLMTSTYLKLCQVFPRGRPSAFGAEPHLAEGLFRVRSREANPPWWSPWSMVVEWRPSAFLGEDLSDIRLYSV